MLLYIADSYSSEAHVFLHSVISFPRTQLFNNCSYLSIYNLFIRKESLACFNMVITLLFSVFVLSLPAWKCIHPSHPQWARTQQIPTFVRPSDLLMWIFFRFPFFPHRPWQSAFTSTWCQGLVIPLALTGGMKPREAELYEYFYYFSSDLSSFIVRTIVNASTSRHGILFVYSF